MKYKFVAEYKCRMCKKKFRHPAYHISTDDLVELEAYVNKIQLEHPVCTHYHPLNHNFLNGDIGVADFVGMRNNGL